jgi:transcriptional regulator with XRE-family HTH domain
VRRENFGKLIVTLRQERLDFDTGGPWTRKKLSEVTGISYDILSNLETGKKTNLQQDDLVALANAFQLSTGERRGFINAANGVDTKLLVTEHSTPEFILEHCREVLETIHSPAILIDSFYDLIGVNMAAIYLFNLQDSDYLDWKNRPCPHNIISVVLDPTLQKPGSIFGRDYREFLIRNVMNFRIRSLPHRHKPYFKNLLARLHKDYPVFPSLWVETQNVDGDIFLGLPYTVITKNWGPLKVMGATMAFPTEFGNLEVIIENPADEHTRNALPDLVRTAGQGFIKLYDWPDKPA